MHIIVFTPEPSSKMGGQPLSTFEVCQYLAGKGHLITLLFIKEGDLLNEYKKFCVQTILIKYFDIDHKNLAKTVLLLFQQLVSACRKMSGGYGSESKILYTDTHKCCLFIYLISIFFQCPTVFHVRQPVLKPMPLKYRFGVRGMNQLIAVSRALKNSWIQDGGIKSIRGANTHVIYKRMFEKSVLK
ncbi:MAG: hypothetical protein O3A14_03445 [Cyanobacteria bacterium]|nr:hypothetical protein [Cyanobacteriota bacterium]